MTNNGLIIALVTLSIAGAPARAESSVGSAQTKEAATADASKERKVCLKEALTGSRMRSQECKTKTEWTREGVNIEDVVKNK